MKYVKHLICQSYARDSIGKNSFIVWVYARLITTNSPTTKRFSLISLPYLIVL